MPWRSPPVHPTPQLKRFEAMFSGPQNHPEPTWQVIGFTKLHESTLCIYIYILLYIVVIIYLLICLFIYLYIYLYSYLFIHTSTKESCTNTFETLTLIRILDLACRSPSFMAPDSSSSWWMSSFVKRICWKISSKSPSSSTPTAAKRRRKEGQLGDDMEPLEMASGSVQHTWHGMSTTSLMLHGGIASRTLYLLWLWDVYMFYLCSPASHLPAPLQCCQVLWVPSCALPSVSASCRGRSVCFSDM